MAFNLLWTALILYIMALIMIMFAAGFQSEGLSILSVVMLVITIIYMILYAIITFILI